MSHASGSAPSRWSHCQSSRAASAAAQTPGLPRTYDVARIDSPTAGPADTFGFGIINAGDLNADGVDDILTSQGTRILGDGAGAENGELVIVSGANGSIIRTIPAPEPEPPTGSGLTGNRSAGFGFYFSNVGRNATGGAPQTISAAAPVATPTPTPSATRPPSEARTASPTSSRARCSSAG